jgi:hypothetical protein
MKMFTISTGGIFVYKVECEREKMRRKMRGGVLVGCWLAGGIFAADAHLAQGGGMKLEAGGGGSLIDGFSRT